MEKKKLPNGTMQLNISELLLIILLKKCLVLLRKKWQKNGKKLLQILKL